jgi:hypothetical protein
MSSHIEDDGKRNAVVLAKGSELPMNVTYNGRACPVKAVEFRVAPYDPPTALVTVFLPKGWDQGPLPPMG